MELYPHQEIAVNRLASGKILCGDVGSGKTITALSWYQRVLSGKHIYVITTAKKRDSGDWQNEASLVGIPEDLLTVDSWNMVGKYIDVSGALFIFDEQRLVGSGAWVKHFYKIAERNDWIMLTATPGDNWLDYIPIFVANGFYKNRTEFKREHVVYSSWSKFPKVERYLGVGRLIKHRNAVLVPMPYRKRTKRLEHVIEASYDHSKMRMVLKDRWNYLENKPIKNVSQLWSLLRRVANEDPSRLYLLEELLKTSPKVIVFYNFNYELDALRAFLDKLDYPYSEWNGQKHEPILESERWVYLVQYTAGSEGWNCITTDTVIFYSLTYSYKQFEQAKGRIDRLNTPFETLHYYIFRSKSGIDLAVWKSLKGKQTFQEGKYDPEVLLTD